MHKKLWNKDFILLLQGNAVSTIGDLMYSVAIGYWVYAKTGSSALMGVMSSISMFVTMFLSPFCGSIVDKCNRKWVIVGIDLMQSAIMLTVGMLAYLNALSVPIVLAAALLAAFGSVFYSPAISTLMLDIIPHKDLVRGQSLHSGTVSLINLVGTAFSGAMVALFGVPLIVIINGLSNLYSAITELFIHVPRTVQQGTQVTLKGVMADTKTAIGTIFSDKLLRMFIPVALMINLLAAGTLSLLLPLCLEKGFSVDMYGYLSFVSTAGSLLCIVLLGTLKLKPGFRYAAMAAGLCATVPFYVLAYLSGRFIPMCIMLFIGSFMNCAGNTVFNAAMMLALPEKNRSAILGFLHSACVGGSALSTVIYGVLGDIFPMGLTFAIGTTISLIPISIMSFSTATKEFMLKHLE